MPLPAESKLHSDSDGTVDEIERVRVFFCSYPRSRTNAIFIQLDLSDALPQSHVRFLVQSPKTGDRGTHKEEPLGQLKLI